MTGEFWAVRRPGWVAAGLLVAIAAMTVWLLKAKSGGNTATVLALAVSVASLAVAFRGLRSSPPLSRVARELADEVVQDRGRARRQALGMSGDFRPADVTYRSPLPQDEPDLVSWRSDGGPEHGTLASVADFYRSLDRGRMVVLGEPGAGKTVLATQLVIDLVEALPDGELQPGARPPVPVWLSLTSIDLGDTDSLAAASAEEIAARLDQQIALQISASYQISRPAAESLTRGRWVLPVLDGLDEMDPPGPDASHSGRPRAAAVVRALNSGTGRRPVVVVCRRGEYGQLARSAVATGEDPVLQDASQIVLQPLDLTTIYNYLTRRFPGESPGTIASRWQNVQAALQAPTTPGQAVSLADVLSSPWRLFLAATAYQDRGSDPDELIRLPATDLGGYLIGQLIPAVAHHTPRPRGDHYRPGDVHTWLVTLARHLFQTSNDPKLQWSPTDLRLERLWPIAGQKSVPRLAALACSALLGVVFAIAGLVWVKSNGHWYPNTQAAWTGLIGVFALIVWGGIFFDSTSDRPLNRLELRFTSSASRRRLIGAIAGGLATGLVYALGLVLVTDLRGSLAIGKVSSLLYGLLVGLIVGLADGLGRNSSVASQPTSVMRQNITYALTVGLATWIGIALVAIVIYGQLHRLAIELPIVLGFGLAFGLASGIWIGLVVGLASWIRYLVGCRLARRRGKLPPRVGQFFDWAYRAGLLRMSGTAVQFRHRELQAWLVSNGSERPA